MLALVVLSNLYLIEQRFLAFPEPQLRSGLCPLKMVDFVSSIYVLLFYSPQ